MSILPENIELMARFLGHDDPDIQRLLKTYIRESEMRGTVCNLLKRRCVRAGFDPDDPPAFWPVRHLPPGQLKLCNVMQGIKLGQEFALPQQTITQHLGLFGHNGTGKSFLAMQLALQAIKAGMRVWIFDIEDEYSRICKRLPSGVLSVLEPEQLRINLFQPPGDWTRLASWLDELSLLLRGGTFLRDGSLNVFRLGVNNLFERKGVTSGTSDWPSLLEVIEYFQGIRFGPKSRTAGFLESLLNRLVTLSDVFDKTAEVSNSNMLEMLAGRSVIFRLHSLVGIPLQCLVSFLLLWLARFREGSPENKPHLVILEEAHMLTSEKSRQDIGESILSRMFRTARKRGIALILCDQVPSELPPAILGNLACRIVMRLTNARCIWSIQNSMGLNRKQAEAIAAMESRRAVVHYTLHPMPFEIQIPEISLPTKTSEPELCKQAEEFLSETQWHYHDKSNQMNKTTSKLITPGDLAGDALQVMVRICDVPAESIEQRCEYLRIDRSKEFRARAELDSRGLISEAEKTVGGRFKLFQPADKGIAWAQERGIRVRKYKSGIVHEYLLCQVEKHIGILGPRWRLQRNSSVARDQGMQPDLLVMGPDGQRIIVEICCSNLDYDAQNILIESAIPGIDGVVAVTPDKQTKQALENALIKNSETSGDNWQELIIVLDAGECLKDEFDWSEILVDKDR